MIVEQFLRTVAISYDAMVGVWDPQLSGFVFSAQVAVVLQCCALGMYPAVSSRNRPQIYDGAATGIPSGTGMPRAAARVD